MQAAGRSRRSARVRGDASEPAHQALTIGILSYDGGVHFGLLADRDPIPDISDAAGAIERALAVLTDSAR
jgi:WS/DGAT C-terminal domain